MNSIFDDDLLNTDDDDILVINNHIKSLSVKLTSDSFIGYINDKLTYLTGVTYHIYNNYVVITDIDYKMNDYGKCELYNNDVIPFVSNCVYAVFSFNDYNIDFI